MLYYVLCQENMEMCTSSRLLREDYIENGDAWIFFRMTMTVRLLTI